VRNQKFFSKFFLFSIHKAPPCRFCYWTAYKKKGSAGGMVLRLGSAVLLFLASFSINVPAAPVSHLEVPRLRSAAAIVRDQLTGEILIAKKAEIAMPIASITKLMTAMVVLDADLDMEQAIKIEESDKDKLRHSSSHLLVGTTLTRHQALLLALMSSENRAAHALGRTYPGGVNAIVEAMNEKARALSLTETRFEDPTGLMAGNVSSAHDLSWLVQVASSYPEIRACTTSTEYILQSGRKRLYFRNTNPLVRNSRWQIGLSKTGYIEESGRSLVMQTLLAQRPVLIVLLNSSGSNSRIGDANRIRDWLEGTDTPRKSKKHRIRVVDHRVNRT
jgi:D-alanyl-D-alanine endopeptidase (penicillin-binding protein 7)